ncbi:MAG: sigma-54 interaction domain-containing protein [Desulfonatronovibrionaceae bacterium]
MTLPADVSLASILDSVADGVFTVDLDWNVTYFNAAAREITGIPAREAVGRKCWEVFKSSICDRECALNACLEQKGSISNKSIYIVRPDGEKIPVSISAAPLKNEAGETIGGVETFRDLSDLQIIRQQIQKNYTFEDIVGKSKALKRVFSILPQVAKSRSSVLITGESGTGKELFAKAIHSLSERRDGPFIVVNCGALPENLLESELFGYRAGAFTDAKKDKPGRFQAADKGTIFLDEIGDMPLSLQVKLLRFLQEKTFQPLGANENVQVDTRVVAATHQDLSRRVKEEKFRQDLYYRLNVVPIDLPPLRERVEDIPLLVNHFIRKLNAVQGKDIQGISEDALAVLMRHNFPGNIRELENILEFAFILCPDGFIRLEHLPEHLQPGDSPTRKEPLTLEEIKCQAVMEALARNKNKKMQTCRELGISKDTLRRMLKRCSQA